MRVREIMAAPVYAVSHTMPLNEAADLMRRQRVHHLVVKESGRILGVLSTHDIRREPSSASGEGWRVGDFMSASVATVSENDTVRHAAHLMRGRSIGCLAVTRDDELAGIVTVSHLLSLLGQDGDRRREPSRAGQHDGVPHRKQQRGRSC